MVQAAQPFSTILIYIMSLQKHLLNHYPSLPGQITSYILFKSGNLTDTKKRHSYMWTFSNVILLQNKWT